MSNIILRQAVQVGNLTKIKKLIDNGANVNQVYWDNGGETLLEVAISARQVEVLKLLLEAGANPNYRVFSSSPLLNAAGYGCIEIVKILIESGANINDIDNSPLNTAVIRGHLEVVKLLIQSGANINIFEQNTNHPLFWSIGEGHLEIYQYLAALTNPKQKYEIEKEALFWTVCNPNPENLKVLLHTNIDLNTQNNSGKTAFILAVEHGKISIIKILLYLEVELNIKDNKGKTALTYAKEANDRLIVRLLKKAGAKDN